MTKLPNSVIVPIVTETTDLISAAQAANLLGCSVATVHRRVADGDLVEAVKLEGLRGARLFRRSDVLALAEQTTGAAS